MRGAESPDDILDIAADEARRLSSASHAWAGRIADGAVVSLRRLPADEAAIAPPADAVVGTLLAAARPVARADGFVAVALLGSSSAPEGLLVMPVPKPAAGALGELDLALGELGALAGFALEAARLRLRIDAVLRARETLLASVSHDLRNPLNTFAMSAGLLRDDAERNDIDATRAIGLVSRMERATTRMQTLIDDLVEASRIDAKKIDYAMRTERAAQIVKDFVATASRAGGEKAAAVVCDAIDEGASVRADRARMLQLLSKVIAFESKCTGDGGTIHVGVTARGDEVVFTARATGPSGVPVPPADESRGGLALLIARGLAEGQRGTLRIEPNGGLAVAITLPTATS